MNQQSSESELQRLQDYINNCSLDCPYPDCDSKTYEFIEDEHTVDKKSSTIIETYICDKCYRKWNEVYQLVELQLLSSKSE